MKYSKLKHEIELKELHHRHELELMKLKHDSEINELKSKCTHKYEDGTSAMTTRGMQWDSYSECAICKRQ